MRSRLEDFSFCKGDYSVESNRVHVNFEYHELNDGEYKVYLHVIVGEDKDRCRFLLKVVLLIDNVLNPDYLEDEFLEDVFCEFAKIIAYLDCFADIDKNVN